MTSVDGNLENLSSSLNFFTPNLYQAVALNSTENIFFSPFSIATILSMIYLGSRGNTARQLEDRLNASSLQDKIHLAFHNYLHLLQSDAQGFTFKSANRVYINRNLSVSSNYKKGLSDMYLTSIESVDFNKRVSQTKDAINKWVEQYTNGKIKNLIPDGSLKPETLLVLINAIYFKGKWMKKFPEIATSKREFFVSAHQSMKHETMYVSSKLHLKVDSDLGCRMLELPYVGNRLSMFVILPDQIDGLQSLESQLNSSFFHDLVNKNGFRKRKVDVYIPRFQLESRFDLEKILSKMGLTDVFDQRKSDLSKMVSDKKQLYVSQIVHKAFIEVNEEGTKAAASTAARVLTPVSMEIGVKFRANHPFMFTIVDTKSKTVLFVGRITNPEY